MIALTRIIYREQVHPRVTGFPGNQHKSFANLDGARAWMSEQGHNDYKEHADTPIQPMTNSHNAEPHYAVSFGQPTGIYSDWK